MQVFNCRAKKWEYVEPEPLTEDEIEALQEQAERYAALAKVLERNRPMTAEEVSDMLIRQQINTLEVDDQTALRMKAFYPEWSGLIGKTVDAGYKFTYIGLLYKTIPANHTFAAHWVPGEGTESLYTRIDETHDGSLYDPIPYDGNMALVAGLYYVQDGVTYLCSRDTGNPVYHALRDLVGIYVEPLA